MTLTYKLDLHTWPTKQGQGEPPRQSLSGHTDTHTHTANWLLHTTTTTATVLRPFFRDHPGEPVPEENSWTLWCKERFTEADTLTIRLGATPSGLTSAHLHHPPRIFLQAGCPSCRPTNSVSNYSTRSLHFRFH